MRYSIAFAAAAAALLSSTLHAQEAAGVIQNVRGDVHIERNGQVIKPTVDTPILANDRIVTKDGGAVGVTLRDNTRMSVGGKSSVALEEYAYNANSGDGKMAVRVLRGTLGMVTGLINKKDGSSVEVRTKTATAGIRGTEFLVEVPDAAN